MILDTLTVEDLERVVFNGRSPPPYSQRRGHPRARAFADRHDLLDKLRMNLAIRPLTQKGMAKAIGCDRKTLEKYMTSYLAVTGWEDFMERLVVGGLALAHR